MGLIKTAIVTGGGIYAVDKIAKASLNRNDNQAQQHTCQRCGYTNGSNQSPGWVPGPASRGPQNDYYYGDYQDQRQFNSSSDDQRGFLPSNQQRASFPPSDVEEGKRYLDGQYQQVHEGTATPPPYNQKK
ncbi:hypothetical protein NA56DRAFT_641907 [Hyaloscypha hepaticicola]|uniref:Uncharacterized protein n=1 Tax=Hyaloscypha hepaticicola TaxID=2082293 RepID=A0A2J6QH71_9HELO|nr:hypothetical protein NA56DRAFT_641907 [Hyaloscypha hepaticicola]